MLILNNLCKNMGRDQAQRNMGLIFDPYCLIPSISICWNGLFCIRWIEFWGYMYQHFVNFTDWLILLKCRCSESTCTDVVSRLLKVGLYIQSIIRFIWTCLGLFCFCFFNTTCLYKCNVQSWFLFLCISFLSIFYRFCIMYVLVIFECDFLCKWPNAFWCADCQ